jgi:aryl-alcohol dehydrogenase-like predicted oxidoreductase
VAVLVNRPFEEGALFRKLRGKPLPEPVRQYASSWSEALLKFIVAHPAVTAAIPATSNPQHMRDNLAAGSGPLPDERARDQLASMVR